LVRLSTSLFTYWLRRYNWQKKLKKDGERGPASISSEFFPLDN